MGRINLWILLNHIENWRKIKKLSGADEEFTGLFRLCQVFCRAGCSAVLLVLLQKKACMWSSLSFNIGGQACIWTTWVTWSLEGAW